MALISISIDVAGSTEAKARIASVSRADADNIEARYKDILSQLFYHEAYFYSLLTSDMTITLDDIFAVKTIGDEIWITINSPDTTCSPEFSALALRVISAALALASRTISIVCFERAITEEEAMSPRQLEGLRNYFGELPLKVHIDRIDHAVESSAIRYESFMRHGHSVAGHAGIKPEENETFTKRLAERVIGGASVAPRKVQLRTDYVGFEVDRFFRCTKHSAPGLVSCGESFIKAITFSNEHQSPIAPGALTLSAIRENIESQCSRYHYFLLAKEVLSGDDLKGILDGYSIFFVLPQTGHRVPVSPDPKWNRTRGLLFKWGQISPESNADLF